MQIRSFRESGESVWVNALSSACERLGPDPRRALGPAATSAAQTGRTHDRTRPMLQMRQKVLAKAGHRQCVCREMCLKPLAAAVVKRQDARLEPGRRHKLQVQ